MAILETFHSRFILMALQRPGIDGLDVRRQLNAVATRDITVVAVTSYATKRDNERAPAAGCDHYVTGPIDTDRLAALDAHLMGRPPVGAEA